jgi:ketosteroid isomerase-like protein
MGETEAFLDDVLPRLRSADLALHNGDAGPRLEIWSRTEPVSLFGAWLSNVGWPDVSRTFEELATRFSNCRSFDIELVAADAKGDLAYTVAYEHTSVTVQGEPRTYTLRVTQVYRREQGEWKVVHRHGDELAPA